MADTIVSQSIVEILWVPGTLDVRAEQAVAETLTGPAIPPAPGALVTQAVTEVVTLPDTPPLRVTQAVTEVMTGPPLPPEGTYVTSTLVEVLSLPVPGLRVSQAATEMLVVATTLPLRLTQTVVEVLTAPNPEVIVVAGDSDVGGSVIGLTWAEFQY